MKRLLLTAVIIATAGFAAHGPAQAMTCAEVSVEARGEPSRFLWLAKTKTRANWRRKVRANAALGPDYANWARAQNTDEHCYSGPSGHLCIFTGTPCKP
jgi:hypothetical protein